MSLKTSQSQNRVGARGKVKQLCQIRALYRRGTDDDPVGHAAKEGRAEDRGRTKERGRPDDRGWRMDGGTRGG